MCVFVWCVFEDDNRTGQHCIHMRGLPYYTDEMDVFNVSLMRSLTKLQWFLTEIFRFFLPYSSLHLWSRAFARLSSIKRGYTVVKLKHILIHTNKCERPWIKTEWKWEAVTSNCSMVAQINIVILIQTTKNKKQKNLLCVANFTLYIYTKKQNKTKTMI